MGARVIAAASSAEKRAACTERGATALIDTATEETARGNPAHQRRRGA